MTAEETDLTNGMALRKQLEAIAAKCAGSGYFSADAIVSAFLTTAIGIAFSHMTDEDIADWLRQIADAVEAGVGRKEDA